MSNPEQSGATMLSLAKIRPGDNPRRYFDQKKHEELVAGFRVRGMLQPMLVRRAADAEGTFAIVAGGRRYRAAIEAFGAEGEVPVIIREMTDQEALEAAIDENDNRADASETEQADAAVRVLAASQGDRAEAARRLAWSPSKLDRRLALASLSDAVKLALDERRIKVGHAELLAAVPGDKQDKALETILSAGIDVVKTRELLMRMTQALAAAIFDKTECTTCPFNSGAQRALFDTHVDDGHCTNPGCFQLKTEAAEAARAKDGPAAAPAPQPAEKAAASGAAEASGASAPAPIHAPAAKPANQSSQVTAASIAARAAHQREAAWRNAIASNDDLAKAFEASLRETWQVDAAFLGRFNREELKFIAQECGLVSHMGEKAFAKLLASKPDQIVAGMLNATGFIWAGRLLSAVALDGKYSPRPAAPAFSEKDPPSC